VKMCPNGDSHPEQTDSGERGGTERPRAAASVDAADFASLLATAERPVFLYAMSLLRRLDDAEEVLQRTRVVLWQKFSQFERGTDFTRWAYEVARLEAKKIRGKRQREEPFSAEFLEMLACEGKRSQDILEARRQALKACLGKLRAKDRDLVLLRYQRGATAESVAKALDRSPEGTRSSLRRLRQSLADCVRRTLAKEEHP